MSIDFELERFGSFADTLSRRVFGVLILNTNNSELLLKKKNDKNFKRLSALRNACIFFKRISRKIWYQLENSKYSPYFLSGLRVRFLSNDFIIATYLAILRSHHFCRNWKQHTRYTHMSRVFENRYLRFI